MAHLNSLLTKLQLDGIPNLAVLSVEFNEAAGSALSALSLAEYKRCLHDIRVALGLNKHITLEELDVRFGPPPGVIEYSRKLLDEFKQSFCATMSPSVSGQTNWADSAYVVGAFALVCKCLEKRVASKVDIIAIASIKPKVYTNVLAKLEEFGNCTLAEIDSGGDALVKIQQRNALARHWSMSATVETHQIQQLQLYTGVARLFSHPQKPLLYPYKP
ncbi:hypothetical protein H4218_000960 [Coemansia sp. IMI 209128]|nr:hypothetical protein H4218_000960 [Coemansia sp. IMI 209128]